ncbi:LINE-1 retrotransposable element ORF1 protein [Plecturocebus cupreus]
MGLEWASSSPAAENRNKQLQHQQKGRPLRDTTRKSPTSKTKGVPECDRENETKLENTLQDIIQENFPNLARQANIQIEEIQRTPQRYSSRRATPKHIIVRFTRVEMKEKMLRAAREKGRVTHKGSPSDSQWISWQKLYKPEENDMTVYLEDPTVSAQNLLKLVNVSNYSLVMESDAGTFLPTGLQFTGSEKARAIMEEVMSLLQPLNITQVLSHGEGTDINFWIQAGVPGPDLRGQGLSPLPNEQFFRSKSSPPQSEAVFKAWHKYQYVYEGFPATSSCNTGEEKSNNSQDENSVYLWVLYFTRRYRHSTSHLQKSVLTAILVKVHGLWST